mmetsp:Transcript_27372/g.71043  ORF Transcript_27372/g.71043 Transcript_27372/m.71043 type:complete len:486 (+) Transcript_27372:856-2313(+)
MRRHAQHLDDPRQQVVLRCPRKERQPQEHLGRDAPKGPHVDGHRVGVAQQHLRGAVEARLDVRVDRAVRKAGRAEVDDFDLARVQPFQQHVLGLEITVDDARVPQHHQRVEDLGEEDAEEVHAEAAELIVLDELVKIDAEQLEDEAEVLPVHKEVMEAHDVVLVLGVTARVEQAEHLDLHARLVVVRRLVLYHLHRHILACRSAPALGHLPKGALPEHLPYHVRSAAGRLEGVLFQHDQVVVLIIEAVVAARLRRVGQHAPLRRLHAARARLVPQVGHHAGDERVWAPADVLAPQRASSSKRGERTARTWDTARPVSVPLPRLLRFFGVRHRRARLFRRGPHQLRGVAHRRASLAARVWIYVYRLSLPPRALKARVPASGELLRACLGLPTMARAQLPCGPAWPAGLGFHQGFETSECAPASSRNHKLLGSSRDGCRCGAASRKRWSACFRPEILAGDRFRAGRVVGRTDGASPAHPQHNVKYTT